MLLYFPPRAALVYIVNPIHDVCCSSRGSLPGYAITIKPPNEMTLITRLEIDEKQSHTDEQASHWTIHSLILQLTTR